MILKPLIKGLLTFIPGSQHFPLNSKTGGTDSAAYCYDVWLKHLTLLWNSGLRLVPNTVAEIGPGDSLGIGLAALLSGANTYYALDVINYYNVDLNIKIFDTLVELFRSRAGRSIKGWPDYDKYLNGQLFPSHILTNDSLIASLSPNRIAMIREILAGKRPDNSNISINYIVPWITSNKIREETVDVIISHSVLEHVNDLSSVYMSLFKLLKPGGFMSHQLDLGSHGLAQEWNGHRAYSESLWKVLAGRRRFLINRQPPSVHRELMKKNGFEIVCDLKIQRTDGIKRERLSAHWRNITDDDLTCSGAFIQAKRNSSISPAVNH